MHLYDTCIIDVILWHFPTQAHSYQQAGHILTRTTQIYATLAPRFHLVK